MKHLIWIFGLLALIFGGLGWFSSEQFKKVDASYRAAQKKISNLNREILSKEESFWQTIVPFPPKQDKIQSIVEIELAYENLEKRLKSVKIDDWRRYNSLGHVVFREFLLYFFKNRVFDKKSRTLLAKSLALFKEARRRCDSALSAEEARLCQRIASNNIDFLTRDNLSKSDRVGMRTGLGNKIDEMDNVSLEQEKRLIEPMVLKGASRGKSRGGSK